MDATKQKTLPARARVVLSIIAFWCGEGRTCKTTCKLIAGNTGLSKHQVIRGVADLKEFGYLIVHAKGQGKKSTYILTDESLAFLKDYRSELYRKESDEEHDSDYAPVHSLECAPVHNQECAPVHSLKCAPVQRLIDQTNTEQIIISEIAPPKQHLSPSPDPPSSPSLPTVHESAMEILEALGEGKNRNLSQEVKRNPEKSLSILRWFLSYKENPYKPIADSGAYLKPVFSNPGDYGFRFEQGEWVPPPLPSENPTSGRAGKSVEFSRQIDTQVAELAKKSKSWKEEANKLNEYNICLAAWWLRLDDAHRETVMQEGIKRAPLLVESDKTYRHWLATICFKLGMLPGAVSPPVKPLVKDKS